MKKTLVMVALAASMAMISIPAHADSMSASDLALMPFKVVTGVAGMGVGVVAGGMQGVVDTEKKFSENTFGQADKNPMMLPLGLIGAVVAVPVGFVTGAPQGMVDWGKKGYDMWGGASSK